VGLWTFSDTVHISSRKVDVYTHKINSALSQICGEVTKISSTRRRMMPVKVNGSAFPENDCSGNSWLFARFSQG
jgi:hypothetical protein